MRYRSKRQKLIAKKLYSLAEFHSASKSYSVLLCVIPLPSFFSSKVSHVNIPSAWVTDPIPLLFPLYSFPEYYEQKWIFSSRNDDFAVFPSPPPLPPDKQSFVQGDNWLPLTVPLPSSLSSSLNPWVGKEGGKTLSSIHPLFLLFCPVLGAAWSYL